MQLNCVYVAIVVVFVAIGGGCPVSAAADSGSSSYITIQTQPELKILLMVEQWTLKSNIVFVSHCALIFCILYCLFVCSFAFLLFSRLLVFSLSFPVSQCSWNQCNKMPVSSIQMHIPNSIYTVLLLPFG